MTRALATAAAAASVGWAAVAGPPLATAQEPYAAQVEVGEVPPSEAEPLDTAGEFGFDSGFGPGMTPGMMDPGMMDPGMMDPGMMGPDMMGPGMMGPGMMSPGMMGSGMMGPGMMGPGMGGAYPGMYPGAYPGGYAGGNAGGYGSRPRTSRLRAVLSVLGRPSSGIPGYYNWMRPVRRPLYRTPVTYQKYWPRHYYTGGPAHSPTEAAPRMPIVYQPTDTTQLGVTWQHVPTWQPDPHMVPPTPWPWDWHHHVPAQVYREHGRNGVIGAGYNPAGYNPAGYGPAGYGTPGYDPAANGMNGFGMNTNGVSGEDAFGFSGNAEDADGGQPAIDEP